MPLGISFNGCRGPPVLELGHQVTAPGRNLKHGFKVISPCCNPKIRQSSNKIEKMHGAAATLLPYVRIWISARHSYKMSGDRSALRPPANISLIACAVKRT